MTKYGLPIVMVRRADCDSRTPIFRSPSFLGERWCDVLQVGSVGPVISLYPLPAMIGDQSGIVFFKCHRRLKMGSESWSKWNGRANGSAHFLEPSWEHSVRVKRFSFIFFAAWCLFFFFSISQKLRGAFVLYVWCICDCCYHCVFLMCLCVKTPFRLCWFNSIIYIICFFIILYFSARSKKIKHGPYVNLMLLQT